VQVDHAVTGAALARARDDSARQEKQHQQTKQADRVSALTSEA
jgi:hypothetical protein